ncbi:hypothetical protein [Pseudarthrobacter sp. N5]|uniref:hypothetical protein n=1 Tax=Pseudarthrobacter sp. N5 TaxID=3418416 RepID=UPI003CF44505
MGVGVGVAEAVAGAVADSAGDAGLLVAFCSAIKPHEDIDTASAMPTTADDTRKGNALGLFRMTAILR